MKSMIAVLFLLSLAACSLSGGHLTPPDVMATPAVTALPTASATPFPPTDTPVPSPSVPPTATPTRVPPGLPWWNDTVFYEIFVRSFYDSNADGIGDFNGLIDKLDYLNDGDPATTGDLGIGGIWLMPIHPSPTTHGYAVTDYYATNPQYGSLEDFRRLVEEAHRRGIRVIIDLVLNHTSIEHPWFIQSQDLRSPYRDWYVWSDRDPGFRGPWGQQVWYELNGAYYYSYFWEGMADLNYTTPAVTAEMRDVSRYWLEDVGVDGFRLDAIGALIEEGPVTVETRQTHAWFAAYNQYIKEVKPESMTIGEVWNPDEVVLPYVAKDEVDLAFEFDLSAAMLASINEGDATRLLDTLRSGTARFPHGQYGAFLTNHDMARVATQLGGNTEKAKAAASLYLALPGVPFIYYGEEIGMSGDAPDEMGRRPMQWTAEQFAGFSDAVPWKAPDASYPVVNVAAQVGDPRSLLAHYRSWIALRSAHPALRGGGMFLLSTTHPGVFACLRSGSGEALLALVNLTGAPIRDERLSLVASALPKGEYFPVTVMGEAAASPLTVEAGGHIEGYAPVAEIAPYATLVFQLSAR